MGGEVDVVVEPLGEDVGHGGLGWSCFQERYWLRLCTSVYVRLLFRGGQRHHSYLATEQFSLFLRSMEMRTLTAVCDSRHHSEASPAQLSNRKGDNAPIDSIPT